MFVNIKPALEFEIKVGFESVDSIYVLLNRALGK